MMQTITISQIEEQLRRLPPHKLAVVLDFVSYLSERQPEALLQSESFQTMLASEAVLRQDWEKPGEEWELGAFVTLFDDSGRVLLTRRRDYPVWNLPGGKVERSETPWQAAVREVREETGLKVELERLTGVYCKPSRAAVVFNFQGRVVGGKLTPTQESAELRYFDLHALPENTLPKHVERIHDSAACHAEVVFKVQDTPSGLEVLGFKKDPGLHYAPRRNL